MNKKGSISYLFTLKYYYIRGTKKTKKHTAMHKSNVQELEKQEKMGIFHNCLKVGYTFFFAKLCEKLIIKYFTQSLAKVKTQSFAKKCNLINETCRNLNELLRKT